VTVIVDFGGVGGTVATRCVPALPRSGLDALDDAGFAVTPVTTQPAFVCRIDGLPGPTAEACATTPPATAYWTYWTAPRGGSWRYSPVGAAASRPTAGTVEGWSFTTGAAAEPPGVAPPALVAATPPPTPRPTVRPTAAPTPRPTARPTATPNEPEPAESEPEASILAAASLRGEPSVSATSTASTSASPTPTASAAAAEGGVAPPRSEPGEPAGAGPLGTLAGIAAVAAVGGAALLVRRRTVQAGG
jgi:hypothetical protein